MSLSDPNVQKGIWAAILVVLSSIGWWCKRRIGLVDTLADKVAELEKNKVGHDTLERRLDSINQSIREGHHEISGSVRELRQRVDLVYRDMPKRDSNHKGEG